MFSLLFAMAVYAYTFRKSTILIDHISTSDIIKICCFVWALME